MIPEQTLNLTGKVALVSGAGVGIGRAVAWSLGQAGAFIGIHYHSSKEGAEKLLDELSAQNIKAMLLPADLTNEEEANTVVDKLVAEAGRLDI
ncbi:MAG: SDR family NAD(P)-dependent oxidoreductase, partial [Methylococcaceae bacterium]|nr:SDR family NAD(P)-dependent oxidoreductase [Methylococcaceae bacterium]